MKNIKLLAAFDTFKLILAGLAGAGVAYVALENLSTQTVFYILGAAFVMFMLNMIYQINLTRRKYQEISKVDSSKE